MHVYDLFQKHPTYTYSIQFSLGNMHDTESMFLARQVQDSTWEVSPLEIRSKEDSEIQAI